MQEKLQLVRTEVASVYLAALSKAVEGFIQRALATLSKQLCRVPTEAAGSFQSTSKLSAAKALCSDSSKSTHAQCGAQLSKECVAAMCNRLKLT